MVKGLQKADENSIDNNTGVDNDLNKSDNHKGQKQQRGK